jgi:hypothetical protein
MKKPNIASFLGKFNFDPEKTLFVGIERESFTARDGTILPLTPEILPLIQEDCPEFQRFGYELSACQLEMQYGPYKMKDAYCGLILADDELTRIQKKFNFKCYFADIADQDIPLDVYPDPTGRYGILVATLKPEVLHAACYVAGTHIHIGMPSATDALRVYNQVCNHTEELIESGDNSNGERLRYYSLMSKAVNPVTHMDTNSWFTHAVSSGHDRNPRNCWTLIRISIHGTIEFRMFGSTPDLKKVHEWASMCHDLCKKYL